MNRSIRVLLAVATAGLAGACEKSDMPIKTSSMDGVNTSPSASAADARGTSMVRVVNAVSEGPDVSVQLGGQTLFAQVMQSAVTDYQEVALNLAQFAVHVQGVPDGMMLAEQDRMLLDGSRYTVFLVADDSTKRSLRVVRDHVTPDSGKARLRVLHAAPNASGLDFSIAGSKDKLFSDVKFKNEAGYADVVPGKVSLEVRGKDTPTVLLRIANLDLRRSTATTVVITGTGKLKFFTFTDALMAPVVTP